MNDVSNRAVREFSEFLNSIEADFPKPTCTTAYEITMKSTIVSALITLDTEKQMDERFWNHLRVQRNILDFLYIISAVKALFFYFQQQFQRLFLICIFIRFIFPADCQHICSKKVTLH